MEKLDGKSKDIVDDNIDKLKQLFPDVFTEDGIDFDALKGALGEYVDAKEERYQFTWHGKTQARRLAQTPSTGTLRPCKEESVSWDNTENLFIEGDNLEVLKLLQKTYHKKIKMIYIDPPYNTGNDFVYKDDFRDNIKNYKQLTCQVDGEGKSLSTNSETSGRYHTDWLNMMYPRLKLARNLLKDDGVIFISIDDNEGTNLRKLCDDIFGQENFVAIFPWKKRSAKSDVPFGISQDYEWIICFSKGGFLAGLEYERKYYETPDFPNDKWRLSDLTTQKVEADRPNSAFDLVDPKTAKVYKYNPRRLWGITKDTFQEYYDKSKIVFPDDYDFLNISIPAYRVFESEDKAKALQKYGAENSMKAVSTCLPKEVGMTQDGNKEVTKLIGDNVFSFPKPSTLIKYLLKFVKTTKADIILDFFSGSCTTAQATLELNRVDEGTRRFIMVQLPEPCDEKSGAFKAGYKTIADIGKERIRRVIKKIAKEKDENLFKDNKLDLGFKVFKLDASNIATWDPEFNNIKKDLLNAVDNIKTDRNEEDVLYEILLKYGLDLTVPIEELDIKGVKVFVVGMGALIVCLASDVTTEIIEEIAKLKEKYQPEVEMRVVFKDSSFKDDVVKTNAVQILKQHGIEDVKSI